MNGLNPVPLSSEEVRSLYNAIRKLPTIRRWTCGQCGRHVECSSLLINGECDGCGARSKLRAYTGATDLEDIMLIALRWLQDAGVEAPAELAKLSGRWEDWDEYYSDDD